ncbi:MAG TPA: L,D-transpeptidase [Candidatus Binataceae bacterium]
MSLRSAYGAALVLALIAMDARVPQAGAELPPNATPVSLGHEVSGERFAYQVEEHDTSDSIASHFGEPALTLFPDGDEPKPGDTIIIDNRHVAAAALAEGIVINVPQRMLFVFQDGHLAGAWPVTVGRPDWRTPLGSYRIAALELNPTWHVPPAIRAEMEDDGIPTSTVVKPGPSNPLGQRWIGLDHGGIGIHGTNHPNSIFYFGSHGCIRLAPEAVSKLFHLVKHDEQVEIVYQPVTLAVLADGRIFMESDADPYEQGRPDLHALQAAARAAGIEGSINWSRASRALVMVDGIARRIDLGGEADSASGVEPAALAPSPGISKSE